MSKSEMFDFIRDITFNCGKACAYADAVHGLANVCDCKEGVTKWLESEVMTDE